MSNVSIGLVTVLFNSDDVLEDFFKSLSIQNFKNFKLYLVDNSFKEKSFELINNHLKQYGLTSNTVFLPNESNVGIAEGNNIGIKRALEDQSEYVLLLNNDISFDNPNLIGDMVYEAIFSHHKIIVPKIYYYNTDKIWFIDGVYNYYRVGAIHLYDQIKDIGQFNEFKETDYAPTCFMLISKEVFEKVGLMDSLYFVYMDDVDFIYRAKLLNYKIKIMPNLIVEHKVGFSTGGSESEFSFKYSLRNRIYFARKFFSFRLKIIGLLYLFSAYLYKAIVYKRMSIYFESLKSGMKLNTRIK